MEPLYQRVAAELRRQIVRGDLPVGEPVPSEAQLADQWSASRGTVRQALGVLRTEGLVGGGRGRPPVVRAVHPPQPFETFESFTSWALDSGRVPGQRTLELARRPAPVEVADALGIDPGEWVVQVRRVRSLDGAAVMVERSTFVEPVGRLLFDADLDGGSIYAQLAAHGVELVSATHIFDAVAADAVDAELLEVAPSAPLLRERRLAHGGDGEPYEYSDDRYRPDRVSFTIRNARQALPSLARELTTRGSR